MNFLTCVSYHCLKGVASIWMMALLTSVFVRTSSLLEALYTFTHTPYPSVDDRITRNKFVRCTHDTDDSCLPRNVLRSPGKVSRLQTKGAVLDVSTPHTNGVDALGTEFRVGWLATELELSLLAVVGALGTGCGTLVS